MNQETLAALDASIKHWEENARADDFEAAKIGSVHCALCRMFCRRLEIVNCHGCPVMDATGEYSCAGTPYYRTADAYTEWCDDKPGAEARFHAAAGDMTSFLKAIRPIGL